MLIVKANLYLQLRQLLKILWNEVWDSCLGRSKQKVNKSSSSRVVVTAYWPVLPCTMTAVPEFLQLDDRTA